MRASVAILLLTITSCCDRDTPRVSSYFDFSSCCSLEVAEITSTDDTMLIARDCISGADVSVCLDPTHTAFLLRNTADTSLVLDVTNTIYRDEQSTTHSTLIYTLDENPASLPTRASIRIRPDDIAVIVPSEKAYIVAIACRDSAWFEEPLIPWILHANKSTGLREVQKIRAQKLKPKLTVAVKNTRSTEISFAMRIDER